MDQLEDKGLLLKQYLREMETSLQQKEHRREQLVRSQQHIRRDMEHRREEIEKLEKDLDIAVGKSRDDIARMLIRRRRSLQTARRHLQMQLDELVAEHQHIETILEEQRLQYNELKLRTDACFRHDKARQYEAMSADFQPIGDFQSPTEEEIELELMQRKEALARGGAE
jgi:phage shock protein A